MMIFRKKERDDILTNEPYAAFIKKFDKLQSVINEKIHIRIDTNDNGKRMYASKRSRKKYAYR